MIGGSPIPRYGYHDEPVYAKPAPAPRRQQPEQAAAPRPKPQPIARPEPEPVQRVSLPGPDELDIRLTEWVDLPPPEQLGIEVR